MRTTWAALVLALVGCGGSMTTARSAFSARYACPVNGVAAFDLPRPQEGSSTAEYEVRGCGRISRFECDGDTCTDDDARGTHYASDGSRHATRYDAGFASASHDLSCDVKSVTKVTGRTFEGCGQRASYKVVLRDATRDDWVLTARVPVSP
ncbi:MAG TPA: hypothetical protein VGH28_04515 [Polyangiaceae bacterium]